MGSVGSASLQVNVLEELEGSAPTLCQKGSRTQSAAAARRGLVSDVAYIPWDMRQIGNDTLEPRDLRFVGWPPAETSAQLLRFVFWLNDGPK